MAEEQFDGLLLGLASQITRTHGPGVEPLLDVYLSFLRRKTDFFTGAAPAMVQAKVHDAVQRQVTLAAEDVKRKAKRDAEQEAKRQKMAAEAKAKAEKAAKQAPKPAAAAAAAAEPTVTGRFEKEGGVIIEELADDDESDKAGSTENVPVGNVDKSVDGVSDAKQSKSSSEEGAGAEDGDADDEDSGKIKPNDGNGADMENYSWVCVCNCVCMFVRMYVCLYVCMYICMYC
jgi:hypothetical protein